MDEFYLEYCESMLTSFQQIFAAIAEYHSKLGYPPNALTLDDKLRMHRDLCLALQVEVSEVTDSMPWKPWRPSNYKSMDTTNLKEEVVDVLFFLGSLLEVWGVQPHELGTMFLGKLEENYNRISSGYNRPKSDMS